MDTRWFCAALFVGPSSFVFFAHFISATVTVAMTSTLLFGGARIEVAIDVGGRCFPGKMLRSGQSARGVLNASPLGAAEARRTDRSIKSDQKIIFILDFLRPCRAMEAIRSQGWIA
jgi:hypothetical protein